MKYGLAIIFVFAYSYLQAQVIPFVAAEISENAIGGSVAVNYKTKSEFGFGATVEVPDFKRLDNSSFSALADLRFYQTVGKSTFIPLIQLGMNFFDYENVSGGIRVSSKAGLQAAIGGGYSYAINSRRTGPYVAMKYKLNRNKVVIQSVDTDINETSTNGRLVLSLGFRF